MKHFWMGIGVAVVGFAIANDLIVLFSKWALGGPKPTL